MADKAPVESRTIESARHSASSASIENGQVESVPVAPVRPVSYAPAAPGSSQRALSSILQRAQQFTASALNAQQTPPPQRPSQQPPAFGAIQRKTSLLTPVATLNQQKSLIMKDEYDAVISEVVDYMDDGKLPETAYDKRMVRLDDIKAKITLWENKEGPVTQPIAKSFITSLADKRRPILKALKESIPTEDAKLRTDGLAAAVERHRKDREFLQQCLDEASASDERMLKNTAQWFQVGKAQLFAVTPTGDNAARLKKAGKDAAKDMAYFPTGKKGDPGHMSSPAVQYNKDNLDDQSNVNLYEGGANVEGWNVPGLVAITRAFGRTKEYIWETLRHEVQHDADWNKGRDAGVGVNAAGKEFDTTGAELNDTNTAFVGTQGQRDQGMAKFKLQQAEISLTRYKTEYRAYSYEGGPNGQYNALDNSVQNQPYLGKNFTARQLAIFKQIYAGYKYTKDNWDANTPLTNGRTFQNEVVAYFNPDTEAFNKYNSPMVDNFYRALDEIGVKEAATKLQPLMGPRDVAPVEGGKEVGDPKDPGVVKLINVIGRLTQEDAKYILQESPAMLTKMGKHLKGKALQAVKDALKEEMDPTMIGDFFSLFDNIG